MRVALVHNPDAGDEDQLGREALERVIREAGHRVIYQSSDAPDWAAVLEREVDMIAVAGGDGTVGAVAKKLIGRRIPIAPLPFGTANNISTTLGLADLSPREIVEGWDLGHQVTFDAGVADGPWGCRYFIEALGVGLFARTLPAADRNKTLKSLESAEAKVAYALRMLRERLRRSEAHLLGLRLDGRDVSGEYVLFEAMNMEFVGPNLYLAPEIEPADGLLDVVLVTPDEREKLNAYLEDWEQGDLEYPDLRRVRAASIELEWNGFEVHFDDEAWPPEKGVRPPSTRISVSVERDAVCFLKPRR